MRKPSRGQLDKLYIELDSYRVPRDGESCFVGTVLCEDVRNMKKKYWVARRMTAEERIDAVIRVFKTRYTCVPKWCILMLENIRDGVGMSL